MIKLKQNSLLGVKLFLAFLASLMLCISNKGSTSALTFQSTNDIQFTFNPSLNITLSSSDLIIDNLTPSSSSDSNIITVSVATNAGFGYYMSATAGTSTGNTNLTSTTSGNVFTNLSSNVATLASFPDNNWGYSYSTDNGSTWVSGSQGSTTSGYNGLPLDNDDSGATGVILANTDSFSNSGSIKFKIGAKASATQATGTYTNVVNFYAVANPEPTLGPVECEAGKICYNVNSLTATEGTMGKQSASDGNTVTLLASNFSRQGYGFAGWSDTYDYSGNLYGPQEDITVPNGTTANGLSLYAIWIPSAGSMQANASSVCSSLTQAPTNGTKTLASVSALTDQRDNETYAIAKLADGKCWMIENLRLESTNSDNSTGALAQGYGTSATYGNFSGLADAETVDKFSTTYSANTLYSNDGSNNTINIGTSNAAYRMPRYNNVNTPTTESDRPQNPTANNNTNSTSNAGMYSYGNYYTWHAAIADLTPNTTNNQSTTNTSLCPSGWYLPKGGDKSNEANNEFWSLVVTGINSGTNPANYESSTQPYYTGTPEGSDASNSIRAYPNDVVYSGGVSSGSVSSRGSYGYYWSSTANSSNYAYVLRLNSSVVNPGTDYLSKYLGRSIRCVAPGA